MGPREAEDQPVLRLEGQRRRGPETQPDRGIRSRSVRGGCPSVLRASWMFLCILGRVPSDVLCAPAGGVS
eukprot:4575893-Pyramimonas_sp.AAC.1